MSLAVCLKLFIISSLIIFIPVRLISFNTETGINKLLSKSISKFVNSNSVSKVLLNFEIIVSLVIPTF